MGREVLITSWLFLLLSIENIASLSGATNRHSGIYVDNGEGQTQFHKLTSMSEKLALEHEILKLLGFPDKPTTTNGKAPLVKRSAPKFLLNIYENATGEGYQISYNNTEFKLNDEELVMIDQSDAIITFTAQQSHQGTGGKPDRVKRMWFDVSTVADDEQMTSAELRLYRGGDAKNQKNRGAFTITVYRVGRSQDGKRKMHFVDTVNSTAGQQGWITMNITESLNHWMTKAADNRGIYLSVKSIDRSDHETRPEDIGIVGFRGDVERQPFMAGFFKNTGLKQTRVSQLSLNTLNIETTRYRRSDAGGDLLKNYYVDKTSEISTRSCKLQNLYVSFKDLQWQDWIIAPEGYDAYYCNGDCKFPLHTHMNATNHAIIQTLMHLKEPYNIPTPCCTPTQLSAISVIYFMDANNVAYKKYKNMVVKGCGCH